MDITRKEKAAFAIAGAGQNMVNTLVGTFLLTYMYSSAVGLTAKGVAALGVFMTVSKIWDAVNDPIMGVVVDKTHTRFGKLRPYILITAVPIAVLTTLIFSIPQSFGETIKLVYFGVVYLVWETFYTLCDIPYWGLAARLSNDPNERTKAIGVTRAAQMLTLGLVTLFGYQLAKIFSGREAEDATGTGWTLAALMISAVGMGLFLLAFFFTKEKNDHKDENVTLRDIFRTTVTCRPLLIVLLGSFLAFGKNMIQVAGSVFAIIVMDDENLYMYLGAMIIVGMLAASLFTPLLTKRFGNKKTMIGSNLLSVAVSAAMYAVGYNSLIGLMIMVLLSGLLGGVFMVTQTAMIADAVDEIKNRTGQNREGVCFSGLTFSSKIMTAAATGVFSLIIYAVGYESGVEITTHMKDMVFLSISLIPAASSLIACVPFFFYPEAPRPAPEVNACLLT